MTELTLELDHDANQLIRQLMKHYGLKNKADVFKKGISLLKIAAYIDETKGELVARKDGQETRITVR